MKYFVFDNDGETYIVFANEVRINSHTVEFYRYNTMVAGFRLDAIIGFNEMMEMEDENNGSV